MMKENKKDNIFIELAKTKDESGMKSKTSVGDAGNVMGESEGQLTVDVFQDGDDLVVESTVAGAEPEDLEINIMNDSVTIRGKRERQKTIEEADYFYQECFWGRFSRSVILPEEVDPEKSKATLGKNGILTIRMPKLRKKKAKKVTVKTD